MATFEERIEGSSSDGRLDSGATFSIVTDKHQAGSDLVGAIESGMRFTVDIPAGATITAAHITLTANQEGTGTSCLTKITLEDNADAAVFSDKTDYQARSRTGHVDWDSDATWTVDTEYESPSLVTLVQAAIDKVGWASGQGMAFFWENDGGSGNNWRGAYPYDGNTAKAALLHVEYTLPSGYVKTMAAQGGL